MGSRKGFKEYSLHKIQKLIRANKIIFQNKHIVIVQNLSFEKLINRVEYPVTCISKPWNDIALVIKFFIDL